MSDVVADEIRQIILMKLSPMTAIFRLISVDSIDTSPAWYCLPVTLSEMRYEALSQIVVSDFGGFVLFFI